MVSETVVRMASKSMVGVSIAGLRMGVGAPEKAALSPYPLPLTAGGLHAQVSRDAPPPLPGGYKVGEHVYFVAASQTTGLDHGMQGEVVGPALAGKGVLVSFPGIKDHVPCYLNLVRSRPQRDPPIAPRCPTLPSTFRIACVARR